MTINPTTSVDETRAAMSKRLGEIIEAVIGDSRIKELMETVPHQESENAGVATGEIALKMGVINLDTKTALLVAQSAERTYQLAEKAEAAIAVRDEALNTRTPLNGTDIHYSDDPVFKFVGSDRDPVILQRAQGTWMAAQMLLNNEIESIFDRINTPDFVANAITKGMMPVNGFKAAAINLYRVASNLLATEGHTDAAQKLNTVAESLPAPVGGIKEPDTVMRDLKSDLLQGRQQVITVLGSDHSMADIEPMVAVYIKLELLTSLPVAAAGRPAPSASGLAPKLG